MAIYTRCARMGLTWGLFYLQVFGLLLDFESMSYKGTVEAESPSCFESVT